MSRQQCLLLIRDIFSHQDLREVSIELGIVAAKQDPVLVHSSDFVAVVSKRLPDHVEAGDQPLPMVARSVRALDFASANASTGLLR